jgi:hypothetical protein
MEAIKYLFLTVDLRLLLNIHYSLCQLLESDMPELARVTQQLSCILFRDGSEPNTGWHDVSDEAGRPTIHSIICFIKSYFPFHTRTSLFPSLTLALIGSFWTCALLFPRAARYSGSHGNEGVDQ